MADVEFEFKPRKPELIFVIVLPQKRISSKLEQNVGLFTLKL